MRAPTRKQRLGNQGSRELVLRGGKMAAPRPVVDPMKDAGNGIGLEIDALAPPAPLHDSGEKAIAAFIPPVRAEDRPDFFRALPRVKFSRVKERSAPGTPGLSRNVSNEAGDNDASHLAPAQKKRAAPVRRRPVGRADVSVDPSSSYRCTDRRWWRRRRQRWRTPWFH